MRGNATVLTTGTLATASAFSRTPANGQIKITDSAVTDFHTYVPALFNDATTGAVAWLYEPKTSGTTGTLTPGRSAVTPGASSTVPPYALPSPAIIATGDAYSLSSLTSVYFGEDSLTRGGPLGVPNLITITWLSEAAIQPDLVDPISVLLDVDNVVNVVLYRLRGATQPGAIDVWRPQCASDAASVSGPTIELQECRLDQRHVIQAGNVRFINCATTYSPLPCAWAIGQGSLTRFSGFSYSTVGADAGGDLRIDGDFLIDGNGALMTIDGSAVFVGNFARWGNSGPAIIVELATVHVQSVFESSHTLYGTVGAGNLVIQFTAHSQGGAVQYQSSTSAVNTFQFDSTGPHWKFPVIGASGFGFDASSGLLIGPTSNTWAHLDGSLSSGGGFGGASVDPVSGDSVRSFTF